MGLEWPTGEGRRGPGPGKPNGGAEEGARRAGSPKLVKLGSAGGRAGGGRVRPRSRVRAGAGLFSSAEREELGKGPGLRVR